MPEGNFNILFQVEVLVYVGTNMVMKLIYKYCPYSGYYDNFVFLCLSLSLFNIQEGH